MFPNIEFYIVSALALFLFRSQKIIIDPLTFGLHDEQDLMDLGYNNNHYKTDIPIIKTIRVDSL